MDTLEELLEKAAKRLSTGEKPEKYEKTNNKIYKWEGRARIISEIKEYSLINHNYNTEFLDCVDDFMEKNGYITAKQFNCLVKHYDSFKMKKNTEKVICIPESIWKLKDLSIQAKCLWIEIHFLYDKEKGGCNLSDEYFMDFLNLEKSQFYLVLEELKDYTLVKVVSSNCKNWVLKAVINHNSTQDNNSPAEAKKVE